MKSCSTCFVVDLEDDDLFCPQCGQQYSITKDKKKEYGIRRFSDSDPVYKDVRVKVVSRKDVKIKRTILDQAYPPLFPESSFSDISDAYINSTTTSNFEHTPKGMFKFSNIPPDKVQEVHDEWKEKLQQDSNYIPFMAMPGDASIEYVPFGPPELETVIKKGIRRNFRSMLKWAVIPLIALVSVYLLNPS